ncbi:hypothetical protein ACKI2N_002480 [Cupriavidus sp. 30B13]|uniref:hypothetical protein n=1 Tax=Cupriavidus sp. 30B13 TaxID=3384241 RepID=UPI003B918972
MIQLNRLEAIVLAALALLAGAAIGTPVGLWYGASRATALGDAKLSELQRQTASANAEALRLAGERFAQEVGRGNRLSADLILAETRIDSLSHQLQSRVKDVTTDYRESPGAGLQPLPRCVFTRGWVREYNAAIGADVPVAGQSAGTLAEAPDASATAAGDDKLPANVDQGAILSHHIDYGARARKLEEQLNRLIDYEEGKDVQ